MLRGKANADIVAIQNFLNAQVLGKADGPHGKWRQITRHLPKYIIGSGNLWMFGGKNKLVYAWGVVIC
eukprot:3414588-Amphidinium_carterae.1